MRKGDLFAMALAAALGAGCGTTVVTTAEVDMPTADHVYQQLPGTTARIYTQAQNALKGLGFEVVSSREGSAINACLREPKRSIHVYIRIASGDRVYVNFYNLGRDEKDRWIAKLFREIDAALRGTAAEREKRG